MTVQTPLALPLILTETLAAIPLIATTWTVPNEGDPLQLQHTFYRLCRSLRRSALTLPCMPMS